VVACAAGCDGNSEDYRGTIAGTERTVTTTSAASSFMFMCGYEYLMLGLSTLEWLLTDMD